MIKYEGHISYIEDLRGDFSARILFGALKMKMKYAEELEGGIYLFGFRIRTLEQIADTRTRKMDVEPQTEADAPSTINEQITENEVPEGKEESWYRQHLEDLETLKKLGKAGWHTLKSTKDTLISLIRKSDAGLRHLIIDVVKKILKQLLPRRKEGDFKYGLNDPYYTAKILEIFALFYAKVGDDLRVEPVWDGYCFMGSAAYEGRIHLSVILWNVFRLATNSSFRKIWREYNDK